MPCDCRFCLSDVDLARRPRKPSRLRRASGSANQKQLRSFRKKFRRTTFVGLNMGIFMTDHAVERLAELRQRQRVCGRAIKDEIDIAIRLEEFTDAVTYLRRPAVFAVRGCLVLVRLFQCCPSLWAGRRGVIAGKLITSGP